MHMNVMKREGINFMIAFTQNFGKKEFHAQFAVPGSSQQSEEREN